MPKITGQDMRDDTHAYEKPEIVDKVAQTLDQFNEGKPSIPEPPVSSADEPESTSEPEPTDDGTATLKEPDGEAAGEGQTEPEKPALPDNYFRAARHQGWEPEEIAEFYDKDPKKAIKTFGKIYESTNNLSQQFAQLGRSAVELEKKKTQVQPTVQPQVVEPKPSLDFEKLRKQYEDDPFGVTVELLKGFSQKPEPTPQATPTVQPATNQQTFDEDMAILQQLNQFFGAEDMQVYEDFYGSTKDENGMHLYDWRGILSPGQQANRQAIIDLADQIISGAELQGREMSVAQGLELAHLSLTRPMVEGVVREKIVSEVKKRSKGVTLKPGGATTTPPGSTVGRGAKTEEQVIANAGIRLKALKEKGL